MLIIKTKLSFIKKHKKTKAGKHHCLNCKEDFMEPVRNKEVI